VALYSSDGEVVPGLVVFVLGAVVAVSIWLAGYRRGKASARPDGAEDDEA
jgi:hypothetical protein